MRVMQIFKKEKAVVELARSHVDSVTECVRGATATVKAYLDGDAEAVASCAKAVDESETAADIQRREIGDLLYAGAYLPAIREDIFFVVDTIDVVAGMAESCCDFFMDQRPDIPTEFNDDFDKLMDLTLDTAQALRRTLRAFFKKKGKTETVRERAMEVSKLESRIDDVESSLTRRIFASDLDIGHKVHLRNAVAHIVRISDRAEDASEQVELVSMKALV